ncbi:hypothetical protein T4B_1959, partial [Trichinella pseudospiralis]
LRYMEESSGQEHSYLSFYFFLCSTISWFQSELTNFPVYRLAEVEVATLYRCIRKVALNRGYQGCFKITNYCLWTEIDREDCQFTAGTSLPATKAFMHCGPCPGSHGCLQSNFRSCSKYQYICLDALWSLLSFSNSVTHHRSLPYSLDGHFAFWNIPCGSVFTFMQLITMMVMYNNYSAMRRTDDNK